MAQLLRDPEMTFARGMARARTADDRPAPRGSTNTTTRLAGRPRRAGKPAASRRTAGSGSTTFGRVLGHVGAWWAGLSAPARRAIIGAVLAIAAGFAYAGLLGQHDRSPLAVAGQALVALFGWGAYPLVVGMVLIGVLRVAEMPLHRVVVRGGHILRAVALWLVLLIASRLLLGGMMGGLLATPLSAPFGGLPVPVARLLVVALAVWLTLAVVRVTPAHLGIAARFGGRHTLAGTRALGRRVVSSTRVRPVDIARPPRDPRTELAAGIDATIPGAFGPQTSDGTMPLPPSWAGAHTLTDQFADVPRPMGQMSPLREPWAEADAVPAALADVATSAAPAPVADDEADDEADVVRRTPVLDGMGDPAAGFVGAGEEHGALPLPPLDTLLLADPDAPDAEAEEADKRAEEEMAERLAQRLESALRSFRVEAEVRRADISVGPTILRFGIRPVERPKRDASGRMVLGDDGQPIYVRTRVSRILALRDDLTLALEAHSSRMEAPVPGQAYIGLEIPRPDPRIVTLREVLRSDEFQSASEASRLTIGLGKDVAGRVRVADVGAFPHLLVAGATGAGKSVWLHALLASLLARATPDEVRLLLVDPKKVELTPYNGVPHMLLPVITEAPEVVDALRRTVAEMERRYTLFSRLGVRNLASYRQLAATEPGMERLPHIVVVIDELADLMMAAPDAVEGLICRLAQLARATGIHLVVATQRPSVDVITGVIKANVPARIAFMVSAAVDSRTILDSGGAEHLLGKGDMLYLPSDASKPDRIQGAFVSDEEVGHLVRAWRAWAARHATDDIADAAIFYPPIPVPEPAGPTLPPGSTGTWAAAPLPAPVSHPPAHAPVPFAPTVAPQHVSAPEGDGDLFALPQLPPLPRRTA